MYKYSYAYTYIWINSIPVEWGCTQHTRNPKTQLAAEWAGGRSNIIYISSEDKEKDRGSIAVRIEVR